MSVRALILPAPARKNNSHRVFGEDEKDRQHAARQASKEAGFVDPNSPMGQAVARARAAGATTTAEAEQWLRQNGGLAGGVAGGAARQLGGVPASLARMAQRPMGPSVAQSAAAGRAAGGAVSSATSRLKALSRTHPGMNAAMGGIGALASPVQSYFQGAPQGAPQPQR